VESGWLDDAVERFTAPHSTQPCLIVTRAEVESLEALAGRLRARYPWPHLNLNRELSTALCDVPRADRSRRAPRWLHDRLRPLAPGPVLCSGIDLLFEASLKLDPLHLFKRLGRTTRLVVLWPGTYEKETLAYAVPEHAHYRAWTAPGVPVISP
jgi:hypothetical protein